MSIHQTAGTGPKVWQRLRDGIAAAEGLAARYERDPELRARIDAGEAGEEIAALGLDIPEGVELKVVANTAEVFHVVFPLNPNRELSEETLNAIGGGKTAGTGGCAGTLSSAGSCAMSVSSVSTAGTGS